MSSRHHGISILIAVGLAMSLPACTGMSSQNMVAKQDHRALVGFYSEEV